jgi:hypothetical protein
LLKNELAELFSPWKKLEWRLKQTNRFLGENREAFIDKNRVAMLDKNMKKAMAKVNRLNEAMRMNDVASLKESQTVHQKYFDKTVGEYKSLAKLRDTAKRRQASKPSDGKEGEPKSRAEINKQKKQ